VSILSINCQSDHKIRILDAYYSSSVNNSYLVEMESTVNDVPVAVKTDDKEMPRLNKRYSSSSCNENEINENDCRMPTELRGSNCNGKTTCYIQFYEQFLAECNSKSNYLTVLYECVPGKCLFTIDEYS